MAGVRMPTIGQWSGGVVHSSVWPITKARGIGEEGPFRDGGVFGVCGLDAPM